jgi:hypothetical protein
MATYSGSTSQSSDDAREASGSVVLTGTNITIQATDHYGGMRFTNVTIDQGDTINTASIELEIASAVYDDPDVTIWAEDTDDAATFTTAANNISGRTPTTATTTWTASAIGGGVTTTPDLAAIVQEVIDRPGWSSGNDIVIIFKGNSTSPLRFYTFDDPGTITLNIDYTAGGGGGGGQPPRSMHQFRQRNR